ncbi:MAG: hypothetical protein F4Y02_13010, partial [Chloroflexi bacterium]|nr:hypothetical protein [Chloroflexota bacterium]
MADAGLIAIVFGSDRPRVEGAPDEGTPDIQRRTRSITGNTYGPWTPYSPSGEGGTTPPATPTEEYRLVAGPDVPGTPDIQRRTRSITGNTYDPWTPYT